MTLPPFLKKKIAGFPAWVLAAALLPRLLALVPVVLQPDLAITGDTEQYLSLAENLSEGRGFTLETPAGPEPDIFRTPGYPLFLSAAGLLGEGPLPAAALQCLLGAAASLMMWSWLASVAGSTGAAAGFLFFATDLMVVLHTPLLLTETLFLFFFVPAARFFWSAAGGGAPRHAALAGLLLALATFARPVSIYLPAVLAPLLWRDRRALLLFLAFSCLPPAAWSLRNYAAAGQFSFSSIGGISLIRYPAASIKARLSGVGWAEADQALRAEVDAARGPYRNEAHRAAVYMEEAKRIILEHPFMCAAVCLKGAVYMMLGTGEELLAELAGLDISVPPPAPGESGFAYGTRKLLARYPLLGAVKGGYALFLAGLYLAAAAGLRRLFAAGRGAQGLFLALGIFYFWGISSYQGYYRFRIPMVPLLAAAAAFAFRPRPSSPAKP